MFFKNGFVVVFIAVGLVGCGSNDAKTTSGIGAKEAEKAMADTSNFTTIQWIDTAINYGTIPEGPKLDILYRFKNTGNKPLVIAEVRPGCGCTVAETPEKPILPGEEGQIKAQFESKGHPGINNKSITVTANTKPVQSYMLKFSVEVATKG